MWIKMKKTTPLATPTSDGPSGVKYLAKGNEYEVDESTGASLLRGGEAEQAKVAEPIAATEPFEPVPVKKKAWRKRKLARKPAPASKDLGAAPENK